MHQAHSTNSNKKKKKRAQKKQEKILKLQTVYIIHFSCSKFLLPHICMYIAIFSVFPLTLILLGKDESNRGYRKPKQISYSTLPQRRLCRTAYPKRSAEFFSDLFSKQNESSKRLRSVYCTIFHLPNKLVYIASEWLLMSLTKCGQPNNGLDGKQN